MTHWIRFAEGGVAGFGQLEGTRISVYAGDMFAAPRCRKGFCLVGVQGCQAALIQRGDQLRVDLRWERRVPCRLSRYDLPPDNVAHKSRLQAQCLQCSFDGHGGIIPAVGRDGELHGGRSVGWVL